MACARAGLAELGSDYAPTRVEDDTDLKLHAADELLQTGHPDKAARMMLRMLGERTRLYAQKHAASIAE